MLINVIFTDRGLQDRQEFSDFYVGIESLGASRHVATILDHFGNQPRTNIGGIFKLWRPVHAAQPVDRRPVSTRAHY